MAQVETGAGGGAGGQEPERRSFKLIVAYDGTDFHGWQIQPSVRTVQGVLEERLKSLLGEYEIRLEASGRTDAGVHARGQVASFHSRTRLPERALPPLLNLALPADVRVRAATEVGPEFGARRSAVARRYAYRLLREDDVMMRRFAWYPRRGFDVDRLDRAARALEGEHDCSAFQSTGSSSPDPVCRVHRARWSADEGGARLDIVADHFLYHMVRNVVGTSLAAARTVLESRARSRGGRTAPPQGLCFEQVFFAEGDLP